MDADITAASTALDLDKIKAQDYRNALAQQAADRAAQREVIQAFADWIKAQYATLGTPDPAADLRRDLALTIADKYFTTGTATLPDSIAVDARNDAARFKAALDEAVKAV